MVNGKRAFHKPPLRNFAIPVPKRFFSLLRPAKRVPKDSGPVKLGSSFLENRSRPKKSGAFQENNFVQSGKISLQFCNGFRAERSRFQWGNIGIRHFFFHRLPLLSEECAGKDLPESRLFFRGFSAVRFGLPLPEMKTRGRGGRGRECRRGPSREKNVPDFFAIGI